MNLVHDNTPADNTRDCDGMTVTQITAPTQEELFAALARFALGRTIDSVAMGCSDDPGAYMTVVWT